MVPAPGRFSITTGWPSRVVMSCVIRRASTSFGEPGVNGTTSLIGFDG